MDHHWVATARIHWSGAIPGNFSMPQAQLTVFGDVSGGKRFNSGNDQFLSKTIKFFR